MNESRIALKVGLFVCIGLALLALLVLNFSKGITLFQRTYDVHISMPTVAGLKPDADVMMAGVTIGKVKLTKLTDDGKSVDITVTILENFKVRKDAKFHIDSLGFLGDQYIEVTPAGATAPFLQNGDTVQGDAPFNLEEAMRSTSGLLDQAKQTMRDLDQAITNINRTVLAGETLTNFSIALSNLVVVTDSATKTTGGIRELLASNAPPLNAAMTNLQVFSQKLNVIADNVDQTISTNRGDLTDAVKNFRDASASLKQLASDLQAGKGMAGSLLKDEQMKANMVSLISNVNATASEFSAFGNNLNRRGIWSMLWKPKQPPEPAH